MHEKIHIQSTRAHDSAQLNQGLGTYIILMWSVSPNFRSRVFIEIKSCLGFVRTLVWRRQIQEAHFVAGLRMEEAPMSMYGKNHYNIVK